MSLLKNIRAEIKAAGGQIAMGYEITKSAPNWFSSEDRRHFAQRHRWEENRKQKNGKKQRKDVWRAEDLQFMLDNFGKIQTAKIGKIINRSSAAIRIKFAAVATKAQKIEASKRTNKSRKSSNFK